MYIIHDDETKSKTLLKWMVLWIIIDTCKCLGTVYWGYCKDIEKTKYGGVSHCFPGAAALVKCCSHCKQGCHARFGSIDFPQCSWKSFLELLVWYIIVLTYCCIISSWSTCYSAYIKLLYYRADRRSADWKDCGLRPEYQHETSVEIISLRQ